MNVKTFLMIFSILREKSEDQDEKSLRDLLNVSLSLLMISSFCVLTLIPFAVSRRPQSVKECRKNVEKSRHLIQPKDSLVLRE